MSNPIDYSFLDDLDAEFDTDTTFHGAADHSDYELDDNEFDSVIADISGNFDVFDEAFSDIPMPLPQQLPRDLPTPPETRRTITPQKYIVPDFVKDTAGLCPVLQRKQTKSPKKRKIPVVEGCTCKNTRCLKKYCVCFAKGNKCDPNVCSCKDCANTTDRHVEPKVFVGCTCRRSKCLKKYCDCFAAGMKCDPTKCSCKDCENGIELKPVACV
tara:strand:+ start:9797 stop:10435 length:639 start_codon:yes stop_codon:yes gene_type:complete